jgi:hypothetical protein
VIWHAAQSPTLPENLRKYLTSAFALRADEATIHIITRPYLFGRGETIALAVLLLPLPTPPGGSPPP